MMSVGTVSDHDHSFIVLDRMTAEDSQKIEDELSRSVHAFNLQSNAGFNGVSRGLFSNHFGENSPATTADSLRSPEQSIHIANGPNSLPLEIQQRMDSLVQENLNLKIIVDKSNSDMCRLMTTLSDMREISENVRRDHKEKFQETRALVLKLKEEKAEMRIVIEELQGKLQELESRPLPSLFEAIVPTVNEIELQSTVDDLQSQLNVAIAARDAEVEKAGTYVEEISSLKLEMIGLKKQLKQLEEFKKETVNVTHDHEELESRLKAATEELNVLREENARLHNDLTNLSSVGRHSMDYQNAQAKGFTHRIDELTAKYMCAEEELQKTQAELTELKQKRTDEALSNATATVERLRSRIDEMTAMIVEFEQKCESKTREITGMQAALAKQAEAAGILEAQVEVYRADFIAERDCRERIAAEKEQLAEDLRRLHRRNLELQNQTSTAGSQVEKPSENAHEAEEEREQSNSTYRCPICNTMTFRTLQAVNEHIDRCLGGFTDLP